MTLPVPLVSFTRRRISDPRPSAVYFLYEDGIDEAVYVGVGYEPFIRIRYHRTYAPWGKRIASWSCDWYESRKDAEATEARLIESLHPRYNIAGTPLHREVSLGMRPPTHHGLIPYEHSPQRLGHYR